MIDFAKLSAPFSPDRVSWRVGSTNGDKTRGMALAYIDARDVMERLDEVCGPAGWQCDYPHANGKTVCRVGIKVGDEWIWKADGAGDTDVEAEKGALSDAFKRAAVRWGIGRYLYDLAAPWVELEQRGRTAVIKEGEYGKLRNLLERYGSANRPPPPVEQPSTKARKSSAQAKKDGDHDRYTKEIDGLDHAGCVDWLTHFDEYTATAPTSWLDPLKNRIELRMEELKGSDAVADDANGMDDAFRATMGGGSLSGVSRNGSAVAHQ